jgi:hypothetical protein
MEAAHAQNWAVELWGGGGQVFIPLHTLKLIIIWTLKYFYNYIITINVWRC